MSEYQIGKDIADILHRLDVLESSVKNVSEKKLSGRINDNAAKEELAKYFQLGISGAAMFGKYIDLVWHSLRENREEYEAFCISACGRVIEHREWETGYEVYYEIPWVQTYHERFGDLPLVWFALEDGKIDEDMLNHYVKTKKIERLPPRRGASLTCDCRM